MDWKGGWKQGGVRGQRSPALSGRSKGTERGELLGGGVYSERVEENREENVPRINIPMGGG